MLLYAAMNHVTTLSCKFIHVKHLLGGKKAENLKNKF